jgi:hypothetical protein
MSFVNATPEYVAAAASDLEKIGTAINYANSAASGATSAIQAAGADAVSTSISHLFGVHAAAYQAISAQAAMFHNQFVQLMSGGAQQYADTEIVNAEPLQAGPQAVLGAANHALSSQQPAIGAVAQAAGVASGAPVAAAVPPGAAAPAAVAAPAAAPAAATVTPMAATTTAAAAPASAPASPHSDTPPYAAGAVPVAAAPVAAAAAAATDASGTAAASVAPADVAAAELTSATMLPAAMPTPSNQPAMQPPPASPKGRPPTPSR